MTDKIELPDSISSIINEPSDGTDKKLALLEQLATLAEEQAALAAADLNKEENSAGFDRLSEMRRLYIEQIDIIDEQLTGQAYSPEKVAALQTILTRIQAFDQKTADIIGKETADIKNQLQDLANNKKNMLTYHTNILARKSMIIDKSR